MALIYFFSAPGLDDPAVKPKQDFFCFSHETFIGLV
jgi:hypothetical protein